MKIDTEIIRKLTTYYPCSIIGSYIFSIQGLLHESSINDVDMLLGTRENIKGLKYMMADNGWNCSRSNYERTIYGGQSIGYTFSKKGFVPIHIVMSDEREALELSQLVAYKFQRRSESDLVQLAEIIKNSLNILRETT